MNNADAPDPPVSAQQARAGFILGLRSSGIMDRDLLNAFESVPHEVFVPAEFAGYAYKDASLPIGHGQSLPSPWVLAPMLDALDAAGAGKVLVIGTGSGYSSALLARLARRVFSVERNPEILARAQANWTALGLTTIVGFHADGLAVHLQQGPFDRIFLTGSVEDIPGQLERQLKEDGVLVAPVGPSTGRQTITRVVRGPSDSLVSEHGTMRIAPLTHGKMYPA